MDGATMEPMAQWQRASELFCSFLPLVREVHAFFVVDFLGGLGEFELREGRGASLGVFVL
jgi:hypothetical protein